MMKKGALQQPMGNSGQKKSQSLTGCNPDWLPQKVGEL